MSSIREKLRFSKISTHNSIIFNKEIENQKEIEENIEDLLKRESISEEKLKNIIIKQFNIKPKEVFYYITDIYNNF